MQELGTKRCKTQNRGKKKKEGEEHDFAHAF